MPVAGGGERSGAAAGPPSDVSIDDSWADGARPHRDGMAVDSPELAALPPAEVVSAAAPAAVAELALAPAAPAAGGAAAGGSGASGALGPVGRHDFESAAAASGLTREQGVRLPGSPVSLRGPEGQARLAALREEVLGGRRPLEEG